MKWFLLLLIFIAGVYYLSNQRKVEVHQKVLVEKIKQNAIKTTLEPLLPFKPEKAYVMKFSMQTLTTLRTLTYDPNYKVRAAAAELLWQLQDEQIPAIMHASDIVVHCSFREGLARALPQAMLAGKPVVAFDVDGAREVVNSNTGVLLEPGDSAGLKIALETLAKSPEMRIRLGDAGREFCRLRFDHHRMIDQIEAVYKRVLERGHKS